MGRKRERTRVCSRMDELPDDIREIGRAHV